MLRALAGDEILFIDKIFIRANARAVCYNTKRFYMYRKRSIKYSTHVVRDRQKSTILHYCVIHCHRRQLVVEICACSNLC